MILKSNDLTFCISLREKMGNISHSLNDYLYYDKGAINFSNLSTFVKIIPKNIDNPEGSFLIDYNLIKKAIPTKPCFIGCYAEDDTVVYNIGKLRLTDKYKDLDFLSTFYENVHSQEFKDSLDLNTIVRASIFSTYEKNYSEAMQGVNVSKNGICATNMGKTLYHNSSYTSESEFTIPNEVLLLLQKINSSYKDSKLYYAKDVNDKLSLYIENKDHEIYITFNPTLLKFPGYLEVLKEQEKLVYYLNVNRKDFLEGIKTLQKIHKDAPLCLDSELNLFLDSDKIIATFNISGKSINQESENYSIRFNPLFMKDLLDVIGGDKIDFVVEKYTEIANRIVFKNGTETLILMEHKIK